MRYALVVGSLLVCVLILPMAGCGDPIESARSRVVGRWEGRLDIDEKKLAAQIEKKAKSSGKAMLAKAFVGMMVETLKKGRMVMVFKSNGTFTGTLSGLPGSDSELSGKWRIVGASGNQVVVVMESRGKKEQTTFEFDGEDEFRFVPPVGDKAKAKIPEGVWFRFKRVGGEEK